MFEIALAVGICLVILGAWFILPISPAELILALFVVSAGALGVYRFWTGEQVSELVEGIGIFAVFVIILGLMRVGIEKLSEMLAGLRLPRFGTKHKDRVSSLHVRGESGGAA